MKKQGKLLAILTALALLLSGCGLGGGSTETAGVPDTTSEMTLAWRSAFWFSDVPVTAVSHGEDYAIEWVDKGMEAHIRQLLGKTEGDILHSDVWGIRMLTLSDTPDGCYDQLLLEPAAESLSYGDTLFSKELGKSFADKDIPWVERLDDLRHFDSLQIFGIQDGSEHRKVDLSGPTQCPNLSVLVLNQIGLDSLDALADCGGLQVVHLWGVKPTTLEPLGKLTRLRYLWLYDCGSVDLLPLKTLTELTSLRACQCDAVSLEPLADVKGLKALDLSYTVFPSLEPLQGTALAYLDMGLSESNRKLYDALDYSPLTDLPGLRFLNLTNNRKVDADLCRAILDGSPALEYLNVMETKASGELGKRDLDTDHLKCFSF